MRRVAVAVVGKSGAGKSRLARELVRRLDVPVIHMGAHFHLRGWTPPPGAEWEAKQPGLFADDARVPDGNFHTTLRYRLARADTVVFLDLLLIGQAPSDPERVKACREDLAALKAGDDLELRRLAEQVLGHLD